MTRRPRPFRALLALFAFWLGAIAPDRVVSRELGAPVVSGSAAAVAAVPAIWSSILQATARAGSPRSPHAPTAFVASDASLAFATARIVPPSRSAVVLRKDEPRRLTYDATAPPSSVAL